MALEPQGRAPPVVGGRFQVVDTLGDGGTATVYLAWDRERSSWCALKAMHHKYRVDDEMRRRFAQEAQALELLRHPNIPRLLAQEQHADPPYMVMELARCGAAMDWVREHGRMPASMAADVIFQVCEALAEAHAAGIVHRDVKPHNFLLDDEGRCKLTDFGIARVTDNTSLTITGSQIGTFSFMAPEQRSDTKSVDHRADIYSVGASLYTLLTAKTSAELFVADKDDDLLSDVPPAFREVVLKATRYKPDDRYASVLELQTHLMNALSRIPPDQAEYPPLVQPAEPLPATPPKVLPAGRRFEDLERWLGLPAPTPAPVEARGADTASPVQRKAIPYFMPTRAGTPQAPQRTEIPDYVDDSEVGQLRREHEQRERAKAEQQARERAEAERLAEPPPEPPDEPPNWGLIAAASLAITAVLLVALVAFATVRVDDAASSAQLAAEGLNDALRVDGAVVYEIRGDRQRFEDIFQRYLDTDGDERLGAALAFVEALDGAVANGGALEDSAEPKVRRLQMARDEYLRTRERWSVVASGFPGVLAVTFGLAEAP